MRFLRLANVLLAMALGAAVSETGSAQVGALKRRAEEARKKVDAAASKKGAADSAKKTADSSKAPTAAPPSSPAAPEAPGGGAASAKADPKIWENYDFVRGARSSSIPIFQKTRWATSRAGSGTSAGSSTSSIATG